MSPRVCHLCHTRPGRWRLQQLRLVYHSEDDQECSLQDDTGDCVEFLTHRPTQQLKVDIDRLSRHMDQGGLDSQDRYNRIQERLIHESYWLAGLRDINSQCSRELARLVRENARADEDVLKLLKGIAKVAESKQVEGAAATQDVAGNSESVPTAPILKETDSISR